MNAFKNIYFSLKPDGLFALECMVRNKKTKVERDYFLDEKGVFWQAIEGTVVPTRKINTSLEMENEILQAGFKIEYLMVHSEKKMIPHFERNDVLETDPEVMRVVARKN